MQEGHVLDRGDAQVGGYLRVDTICEIDLDRAGGAQAHAGHIGGQGYLREPDLRIRGQGPERVGGVGGRVFMQKRRRGSGGKAT